MKLDRLFFFLAGILVVGAVVFSVITALLNDHAVAKPKPISIPAQVMDDHPESASTTVSVIEVPPAKTPAVTPSSSSTQYVLLAFDGSRSLNFWKDTRTFAKEMNEQGKPLHFTYFINTIYLLAYQHRMLYVPPDHATGTSPIGFATNERDVADRLEQMNAAMEEGHEIGSHLMGHYNGIKWTEAQWRQEFNSFDNMIKNVTKINHLEKEPDQRQRLQLPPDGIIGIRIPELGVNNHVWSVMRDHGIRYDTSLTSKPGLWPTKLATLIWEFPLDKIPFNRSQTSSLLSMDYNFFFKQSKAVNVAVKGTPEWQKFYDEMLTSYRDYFQHSYQGNRAPIYIGHHFSLWNDGAYWEVMKQFARETCGLPEVKCVTYRDLMAAMEQTERS